MYPEVLGRDEAAGIADQGRGTSGRAAAAAELLARRGKTLSQKSSSANSALTPTAAAKASSVRDTLSNKRIALRPDPAPANRPLGKRRRQRRAWGPSPGEEAFSSAPGDRSLCGHAVTLPPPGSAAAVRPAATGRCAAAPHWLPAQRAAWRG